MFNELMIGWPMITRNASLRRLVGAAVSGSSWVVTFPVQCQHHRHRLAKRLSLRLQWRNLQHNLPVLL